MFLKKSLLITKPAFFDPMYSKNRKHSEIVLFYYLILFNILYEYILNCHLLLWFKSWIFSIITPVTWSFRNYSNIFVRFTKNIF